MDVNDVYRYQKDLVRIARYYCQDDDTVNDAVQTLYLKLCEMNKKEGNLDRIFYQGKLNMVYIFTAIRNIIINEYRIHENIDRMPDGFDVKEQGEDHDDTTDEMCREIRKELNRMREYDRLMVMTYYQGDHSIRSLSANTGISTKNVFTTLSKVKNQIKTVILNNQDKFPKLCQQKQTKKQSRENRNHKVSEIP